MLQFEFKKKIIKDFNIRNSVFLRPFQKFNTTFLEQLYGYKTHQNQ